MKWLILILPFTLLATDQFDASTVELVDYNKTTGNFLFMGNVPREDNSFNNRDLINAMKALDLPATFPKKYTLVIISLLTTETQEEWDFLRTIYAWFTKKNEKSVSYDGIPLQEEVSSSRGIWYWWLHHAYYDTDPPLDPDVTWNELERLFGDLTWEEVQETLLNQEYDGNKLNFTTCISTLKTLMDTDASKPYVIYFHSRRGHNRNGSTGTAYLMEYKNQSIEDAWDAAVETEGHEFYEPQYGKAYLMFFKRYLELK